MTLTLTREAKGFLHGTASDYLFKDDQRALYIVKSKFSDESPLASCVLVSTVDDWYTDCDSAADFMLAERKRSFTPTFIFDLANDSLLWGQAIYPYDIYSMFFFELENVTSSSAPNAYKLEINNLIEQAEEILESVYRECFDTYQKNTPIETAFSFVFGGSQALSLVSLKDVVAKYVRSGSLDYAEFPRKNLILSPAEIACANKDTDAIKSVMSARIMDERAKYFAHDLVRKHQWNEIVANEGQTIIENCAFTRKMYDCLNSESIASAKTVTLVLTDAEGEFEIKANRAALADCCLFSYPLNVTYDYVSVNADHVPPRFVVEGKSKWDKRVDMSKFAGLKYRGKWIFRPDDPLD